MSRVLTPSILFIGGGIAGCAGAIAFHRKGHDVLVVERELEVRGRFKGEYLQPHAVEFFRSLGFSTLIDGADTVKIRRMRFRDLDAEQKVRSETVVRYPAGAYAAVMPNQKLVHHMRGHAQKILKEKFLVGAMIEPLNLNSSKFFMAPEFLVKMASGETVRVRPKWVIGSDGRQSITRKWIGGGKSRPLGAATLGSPDEFIVGMELGAHMGTSRSPAYQYEVIRSEGQGTLAIFKLDSKSRRCYWSAPSRQECNGKKVWEGLVNSLFKKLTTEKGFDVQAQEPVTNLAGASADTTWLGPAARGRFFLTGDALAITTPFGGQGMTCAVRHIEDLLELLSESLTKNKVQAKQSVARIGEQYNLRARKLFNHFNLINFGLYYLFFAQNPIFKTTTAHVLNHWQESPEFADRVGRLFGGIDQDTPSIVELIRLWGIGPKLLSVSQASSLLGLLGRNKKSPNSASA